MRIYEIYLVPLTFYYKGEKMVFKRFRVTNIDLRLHTRNVQ